MADIEKGPQASDVSKKPPYDLIKVYTDSDLSRVDPEFYQRYLNGWTSAKDPIERSTWDTRRSTRIFDLRREGEMPPEEDVISRIRADQAYQDTSLQPPDSHMLSES